MADRRVRLTPDQHQELLSAWADLAHARQIALARVAAILSAHHVNPRSPGTLDMEPDGAFVFVVSENGDAEKR